MKSFRFNRAWCLKLVVCTLRKDIKILRFFKVKYLLTHLVSQRPLMVHNSNSDICLLVNHSVRHDNVNILHVCMPKYSLNLYYVYKTRSPYRICSNTLFRMHSLSVSFILMTSLRLIPRVRLSFMFCVTLGTS